MGNHQFVLASHNDKAIKAAWGGCLL